MGVSHSVSGKIFCFDKPTNINTNPLYLSHLCVSGKTCLPPDVPDGMVLFPNKEQYRVGESVGFNCLTPDFTPLPRGFYKCSTSFTWEPPLPADLRCTNGKQQYKFLKQKTFRITIHSTFVQKYLKLG